VSNYGYYPYSPALFCTQFLNELNQGERERGLMIGLRFLEVCKELWVFQREGDTEVTHGMRLEIDHAKKLSIPVYKVQFKDDMVSKEEFKG
jgi:Tfp pilus assembly protein PilW